jgi:hypothetical protein
MPRYRPHSLDSMSPHMPRADAMRAALSERPLVARTYADRTALDSLRRRLAATEQWASRLDAAVPARLMVAATLDPPEIARVFEDLASTCRAAAPPAAGAVPSDDPAIWSTQPDSEAARADRLIHVLELLAEHVGGCWAWVPSRNPVSVDGLVEEDVVWELEYSPPPEDLLEVIGSRGVLADATLQESILQDRHLSHSADVHRTVVRLAESAILDLREKAFESSDLYGTQDIRAALIARGEGLVRIHDDFVSVASDIEAAVHDSFDSARVTWARLHERLVSCFDEWAEQVLPATPLDRHKRQAVKRDMPRWVGYVSQYALLLRGNAASLELLRMIGYVKEACRALGSVVAAMRDERGPSSSTSSNFRVHLDQLLVSRGMEHRWRDTFGGRSAGVGRLVAEVVGETGQQRPVPQRDLLPIAQAYGLVTARTASSQADGMEALLVRMQLCGLAAKIPVDVFRASRGNARVAAQQRIHLARDWWFNPLGKVLSARRR